MEENVDEVIELKRFKNEYEAELLVNNLKAYSIYAFIKKDDPTTMGLFRGSSVIVRMGDKEIALEFLKTLED
jgi:hypothetical protein